MALTDAEKEQICRYSGWPLQSLKKNTVAYSSYINQWILDLEYSTSGEETIRTFLSRIQAIDTQLTEATTRLQASGVGHNEVTLNHDELQQLRMERRRVIREMKNTLNIPEYQGYLM